MKKSTKKILALILALVMVFALVACGNGGDEKTETSPTPEQTSDDGGTTGGRTEKLVFRVGWPTSGQEGDVIMPGIEAVCDYVTEKTDGMITFEYFPNQLLGTENDMSDQVITGDLDIAVISNNVAATYWPEFYLYGMPFAFDSFESFWKLCGQEGWNDGEMTKAIRESVEAKGQMHFFNAVCNTFRGMQSNGHAITKLSDFSGITLRVQAGELFADIYYALGASTASIPFGELYTSMQQGVVQAEDVGIATCYSNRYYEVEEYAVELNHCMTANLFLMSNKAFDSLTEEEVGYFMEGCLKAEKVAYDTVVNGDAAAYKAYADNGVEVIRHDQLKEEDIAELRDATASVWDKYESMVGADLFATYKKGLTELGIIS